MGRFLAGAARREITPPVGLLMMGYGRRHGVSTGVRDPLHCRALVLSDGETPWALAVCDLLCFAQELCDPIAARVAAATDIPADHVWVCATHTHSAPFFNLWKTPASPDGPSGHGRDRAWECRFPEIVADTIVAAWERRQPARLALAQGRARIGANRRCPAADGTVRLVPYDDGPVDDAVSVMALLDAHERPMAFLVNHACHGVILTEDNLRYSGDWLGLCAAVLEREHPPSVALVAQGACGDIDPQRRGSIALAATAARTVADAATGAVARATATPDVVLAHRLLPVSVPLKDTAGAVARGRAHVAQVERNITRHTAKDSMHTQRLREELDFAREKLGEAEALHESNERFARADVGSGTLACTLRLLQVNGHPVVGVPGEPFTAFSRAIRDAGVATPAFVLGYCHDYIGYIPPRDAYAAGGYEVRSSRLAPGGHELLLDAVRPALPKAAPATPAR